MLKTAIVAMGYSALVGTILAYALSSSRSGLSATK